MKLRKIIALTSVLILLLGLSSCAGSAKTPEDAVENFLTYFAAQKYKTAFEYVEDYDGFGFDNRDQSNSKKLINAVAASTEFEVVGKTDSENPVEVVAKVTAVDLRELYKNCTVDVSKEMFSDSLSSNTAINEKKFEDALVDAVAKAAGAADVNKITTEVTFKMDEDDGNWFIVMDDLALNNFCGHLNEANEWLSGILSGKENIEEKSEEKQTEDDSTESKAENTTESTEE